MNTAFLKSYQILEKVYNENAFSTITLNNFLLSSKPSDKPLITKIVYTVLDCDIELNYIINQFVKKTKPDTLILLKMGVCCLKYLSIPTYAVVNDIVELSKMSASKYIVGFVNATLKKIALALQSDEIVYPSNKEEFLSVKYSYPLWALKKLIKDFGIDVAEKIVSEKPETDTVVRANLSKISANDFEKLLTKKGIQFKKTVFEDAFLVKGQLNIEDTLFTAQSLSSMIIAHAVGTKGKCRLIDCCSAPGGKAIYIKQLNPDCEVLACDLHPHRVDLIKSYADRMGVQIETMCCDSSINNADFNYSFDYVLCDVPCSGFGVLDSRPDIKLNRQNSDISDLMKLQTAILNNCANYVKVGGILVYSTCTVFHNENSQIVERFLKSHENFQYANIQLPFDSPANNQASYQFLPHKDNVQGFFCARLTRVE